MDMFDLIKKSVAFGVGTAIYSGEKMKQFADDMVKRGEMTSDEANQFVDEMTKKADEESKSLQEWMRDQVSKMLHQAGAADAERVNELEQEIDVLERRIAMLEDRVDELKNLLKPAEETTCGVCGVDSEAGASIPVDEG